MAQGAGESGSPFRSTLSQLEDRQQGRRGDPAVLAVSQAVLDFYEDEKLLELFLEQERIIRDAREVYRAFDRKNPSPRDDYGWKRYLASFDTVLDGRARFADVLRKLSAERMETVRSTLQTGEIEDQQKSMHAEQVQAATEAAAILEAREILGRYRGAIEKGNTVPTIRWPPQLPTEIQERFDEILDLFRDGELSGRRAWNRLSFTFDTFAEDFRLLASEYVENTQGRAAQYSEYERRLRLELVVLGDAMADLLLIARANSFTVKDKVQVEGLEAIGRRTRGPSS